MTLLQLFYKALTSLLRSIDAFLTSCYYWEKLECFFPKNCLNKSLRSFHFYKKQSNYVVRHFIVALCVKVLGLIF